MELSKIKTKGFALVGLLFILSVFVIGFFAFSFFSKTNNAPNKEIDQVSKKSSPDKSSNVLSQNWSRGDCTGEGTVMFGSLPMALEDFSIYIPYGLMIDAHVTPIDHSYLEPADRNLGRDVYDVISIADANIVEIQKRTQTVQGTEQLSEYRIIFEHTCTFYSYFDLVTSLAPDILTAFEKASGSSNSATLRVPVSEGQLIGKIGGQTLDFGVYNADVTLGFVSPELYELEFWKIHTDDPFPYFKEPLRTQLLERNIRTAEPRAGKIDYDQSGKLIGNWFKKDTNGYAGVMQYKYWDGHLSIVPNHIDPRQIMVSIGDFAGETKQFAVRNNGFDPATIDVSSGIIAIELGQIMYIDENTGQLLSNGGADMLGKSVKAQSTPFTEGVLLVQVIDGEQLKVEAFPGITLTNAPTAFSDNFIIYER